MLLQRLASLFIVAALPSSGAVVPKGQVYTVDVYIPEVRHDDQYYNVNIGFNNQVLPVMVDTGSGDILVAADTCNVVDVTSGCYLCETFKTKGIKLLESFGTAVGEGTALGNTSLLNIEIGGLEVPKMSTPLINWAVSNEFQDGSFSGILGLGPNNVSRNLHFNGHLPLIDEMIKRRLLEKPMFSLSLPRLGDPISPQKGKLTLGGIEKIPKGVVMTYNDIIDNPNGAQQLLFRREEFAAIAAAFKGKTIVQPDKAIYFDCSIPQLLELKYHDHWFPVDPLDLIIPSDHGVKDGKELCHAALGVWDRTFADSIIGVPFLRNVVSVFDYIKFETYTVQPRLGLASLTNGNQAVERYSRVYKNRLQNTTPV
ncbi:acid protease [Fusarium sp. NRRL 25303]|nr:acid protease [Fusarium sp. NRRL 25303]